VAVDPPPPTPEGPAAAPNSDTCWGVLPACGLSAWLVCGFACVAWTGKDAPSDSFAAVQRKKSRRKGTAYAGSGMSSKITVVDSKRLMEPGFAYVLRPSCYYVPLSRAPCSFLLRWVKVGARCGTTATLAGAVRLCGCE
jgi:hypothetical protein